MPYRKHLMSSASQDSEKILQIWKQERGHRVGKAVFFIGLIFALVATAADMAWSPPAVWITDLIFLGGCGISLYWIRSSARPAYYWWPAYFGLWISIIPSLWTTGGLYSPFLGIDIALLYAFGAVMETKKKSLIYFAASFLLIPILYILELVHPLSMSAPPPPSLTAIIMALTFGGVYIFINSILRTETELSLEFAEHYRHLAHTEDELKKSESLLREAQAVGGIGSWEWDIKKNAVSWSDELYQMFEVSKENFDPSYEAYIGRLHPEMKDHIMQTIEESVQSGDDFSFENKIQTTKGERFILSRGRVQKDAEGNTKKMLGTCQDITDRKQIESELLNARNELEARVQERTRQLAESLEREKKAKEMAENASLAKMQFLANMSHEIRTPMNSILGFADLLYAGDYSPEDSKEYISRIRTNGTRLLHLIDDILDLSKFEAGQIPIQRTSFSLKALINDILSSFHPLLLSKNLELKVSYADELPEYIYSDSHRLSQIFNNLIGNAVKFTEKGHITVDIRVKHSGDQKSLIVDFKDTGIGIPVKSQSRLFKPFSQGDSSISRKYGGTGLGLTLSKRIAETLGGKLELAESQPGEGSHFQLNLPLLSPPTFQAPNFVNNSKPDEENSTESLLNKKILLAEDSHDNAILICHYIKPLGAHVDIAEDGLKATMMASRNHYDCILMDIQMPGMDGLEATRKIRTQGYAHPIIALTAHALPAEIDRSLAAGCDHHLTKPIAKADLINTLSKFLANSN